MRRGQALGIGAVGSGGLAYLAWLAWRPFFDCEGLGCLFFEVSSLMLIATLAGVAWGFVMRRWREMWAPALCGCATVLWGYLHSLRPQAPQDGMMASWSALGFVPFLAAYAMAGALVGFGVGRAWRSRRSSTPPG